MICQMLAKQTKDFTPKQKVIVQSKFILVSNGQVHKDITLSLYQTCLTFSLNNSKKTFYLIDIDFSLIFTVMKKKSGEDNQKEQIPYGIMFQKNTAQIEFLSTKVAVIQQWGTKLSQKLNQRGFHQLFKPIKKIGKGNFASVYLVLKYEDRTKYAVKAFSKETIFQEQKGIQSLINQIEINRELNHKNLMKLYGVYESQNSIYVSVELLQGGQLQDKIQSKHKFTPLQIRKIMKSILEGLQYMHSRNIMHRDLKPQNIILREKDNYDCVIADFGLGTKTDVKEYLFVRCGTPGYVAPEVVNQKNNKAKYSTKCDLFSLGVIFHIILLNRPPFDAYQYNDLLAQNKACKIDFTKAMYKKLPNSSFVLLKRLLKKDPEERISASEALSDRYFLEDSEKVFNQVKKSVLTVSPCRNPIIMDQKMQCDSPLLTTSNKKRKNACHLRDDSCLKFKIKQNLPLGQCEQGEIVSQINSPKIVKTEKKRNSNQTHSRFRQIELNKFSEE